MVAPGQRIPSSEKQNTPTLSYPLEIKRSLKALPFVNLKIVDPFTEKRESKVNIALYMPPSMRIVYQSNWEVIDLYGLTSLADQFIGGALPSAEKFGRSAAEIVGGIYGTEYLSSILGPNFQALAQKHRGTAINPHAAMFFKNMQFREFQMQWILAPKSHKEAKEVNDLIFQLKYAMHPGETPVTGTYNNNFSSNFWPLPQQFIIGFFAPGLWSLVRTHPCALISLDVDYNGAGVPAYFTDNTHLLPVVKAQQRAAVYTLSLHFQETAILTKDDIARGW